MARVIVMPSMGMYTEEGVLSAWLHPAGTRVAIGEPVAEITTEKATFEIPAPEEGILHPVAATGTVLRVEGLMGYILVEGEPAPAGTAEKIAYKKMRTEAGPTEQVSVGAPLRATPIAKRLAAQHGVDLKAITGSGPGGRIVEADIQAFITQRASRDKTPASDHRVSERLPMAGLRLSLAEGLRRSLSTAASTTLTREVAADGLVDAHQRLTETLADAPSYDALFVTLFAAALRERPELNASIENQTIIRFQEINIGFAIATSRGLIVPVIHNADSLPLKDVAQAVKDLKQRALAGRLSPADVEGGTATISNLGSQGIDAFTPILNGAQSAILGIGRIVRRPVVRNDMVVIGHTCLLSLTFDHRVTDGVPAALLLDAVARRINDEQFLLLS